MKAKKSAGSRKAAAPKAKKAARKVPAAKPRKPVRPAKAKPARAKVRPKAKKPAKAAPLRAPVTARAAKRGAGRLAPARPVDQGAPVVVLTTDTILRITVKSTVPGASAVESEAKLDESIATGARLVLVDANYAPANPYEVMRRLRMRSRVRIALLHPHASSLDSGLQALVRFAGAETVLQLPVEPDQIKALLRPKTNLGATDDLLASREPDAARSDSFKARVLRQIAHPHDPALLEAIADPETRLYSSSYGAFAFDVEFKRATRFGLPLSIALVGFEGECATPALLDLAGIFLNEIRDTDTLARFGVNTFLFILPNTLPDGAKIMLERIAASVVKRKLRDVVGDPLVLTGGLSTAALQSEERREQLFARVQRAFDKARDKSLPAVVA